MSENRPPAEGIPEVVPLAPDAAKPGRRVCPLCGGKFARIGSITQLGDAPGDWCIRYAPRDEEPRPALLGGEYVPSRGLAVRALRVCLECGFVGLFADGGALDELRDRYA